ncbi:unnamed protein product [Rotaria magnacalcarata]|uniref:Cytochrome P450 n=1 Tax=Rotaria magnacalcarata TaxID=392030 RepID=A0A819SML6_9BILA|nr:unnamed protein product [Rotaria magnacalcarata]
MWLTISFYTLLFYVIYRLIKFWIIHPWLVQRDFSNQGIPGHYTPIVGDILDRRRAFLADELLNYIEETSVKLGDYYHTSLGPFPCLTISDPALVESVLKTNSRSYHKAQLARAIVSTILGYENVLLAEDENHTRRRRLLNPVFQHQNINSMISLMVDITSKFSTKWRIKTDEQTYPLICDISKEMSNLTLDIITGCVFGVEVMNDKSIHETIYKSLKIALDEIEKRIYNLIILIPILNQLPIFGKRTIDKCRQDIKNITLQVINQRKQGLTKATWPDLLDLIFAACDDDNKQKFTDDEVADEAMTFVNMCRTILDEFRKNHNQFCTFTAGKIQRQG